VRRGGGREDGEGKREEEVGVGGGGRKIEDGKGKREEGVGVAGGRREGSEGKERKEELEISSNKKLAGSKFWGPTCKPCLEECSGTQKCYDGVEGNGTCLSKSFCFFAYVSRVHAFPSYTT
jgi:hypothetical protein